MIKRVGYLIERIFDFFNNRFEAARTRKLIGSFLVASFVVAILLIELNRQQVFGPQMATQMPTNHFVAIQLAFNLLLTLEILSLVFNLQKSFSISVGKQFEVLSLILLRDTFKEFAYFGEPLKWQEVSTAMLDISATALGSVAIFITLSFYYRLQKHRPITQDEEERRSFIIGKKFIAMILLGGFVVIGFYNFGVNFFYESVMDKAFEAFYTLLVFSDILIVLLSVRYSHNYNIAFRNSGFAVSTILIRIALLAPPYISALIGVGSVLFATLLTYAYNIATPAMLPHQPRARIKFRRSQPQSQIKKSRLKRKKPLLKKGIFRSR